MPQTQPRPAVLAGRAIGQAVGPVESVRTRLLAEVLAQAGTKRETYLVVQRLDALGAAAARPSVDVRLDGGGRS